MTKLREKSSPGSRKMSLAVRTPFMIGVAVSEKNIWTWKNIWTIYLQGGTASGKSTVCKRLMETLGQTDKSDVEKKVDIIYNIYIPIIDSIIDISTFI